MRIVPASEVSPADWDAACDRSGAAWLFHRWSWIAMEARFHGHRDLSFALEDHTGLIGVHPLYVSDVGIGWMERLVHSGIHRHTGLALVDDLPRGSVRAAWSAAMRRVLEAAATEQADRIQLNAQNLAPLLLTSVRDEIPPWVRDYGFDLGLNFAPAGILPVPGMSTCCADQVVSLEPDEPELFGHLDEGCRRAVRKAQKAGVEFEAAGVDEGVADYVRLAHLAATRTGETLPPTEYYESIVRELGPTRRCALLFARHESKRVAGLLLLTDKSAASYLGGVSDPEYLPLRVNDFLHWSALLWAKGAGIRHYRLGPTFPEVPDTWPIARVSRFKTKFGARSMTTIQGSLFLRPEKYLAAGLQYVAERCTLRQASTESED